MLLWRSLMHIVVCAKYVPDPEAAFSMFKIDEAAKRVVPAAGLPFVTSPFDEQAIEAALRSRDAGVDAKITVLTLGAESARNAIKHGLAMGADEGVLLCDPAWADADSYMTAHALAAAIRKCGPCDLVLTGRQAADRDAGVVGAGVGEILRLPVVNFAQAVTVNGNVVRVERALDEGTEIVEAALPALVTISNELGAARKPNLRETMRAARKPVTAWTARGLEIDGEALCARSRRERLYTPAKDARCEFIAGSAEAQAGALARHLHAANLI